MPNLGNTLELGSVKYRISFDLTALNHLCISKELSNLKLAKLEKNERFNTFEEVFDPDFTPMEYRIFKKLLLDKLRENINTRQTLVILFAMSTGEVTRWRYTREQNFRVQPLLDILPMQSSMVLHKTLRDEDDCYSLDPEEDDDSGYSGYEEVTLFAIDYPQLNKFTPEADLVAAMTPPTPETPSTSPIAATEAAIRDFLRSL